MPAVANETRSGLARRRRGRASGGDAAALPEAYVFSKFYSNFWLIFGKL